MRKLSDIDGFSNLSFGLLIKFSKKKYLESLLGGEVYMNTFRCFREMEEQDGKRGMGDSLEATYVINDLELQFINPDTETVEMTGRAESLQLSFGAFQDYHLFCTARLSASMFEVLEETTDSVEARLLLTEEQKKRFVKDFHADSVMFLKLQPFMERFRRLAHDMHFGLHAGTVYYDDFSVNNKRRLDAVLSDEANIFFWKDTSFEYQSEYRIVVADYGSSAPLTLQLGDLSEIATIFPVDKVFNGDLVLKLENQR